jgi:MFS family permease
MNKFDRRDLYVGCDVFLAAASACLIAMIAADWLNPVVIAIVLASVAVISAFSEAAGLAIVPALLPGSSVSPHRVNGMIGSFHNFGDLAGPAIGGWVVALLGCAGALALDAASFVLSAVLFMLFVPRLGLPTAGQAHRAPNSWTDQWSGVRAIAASRLWRSVTVVSAVVNMVATPLLVLLLPVIVKGEGGSAQGLGSLLSCFGAGTLLSSVLFSALRVAPRPWLGLMGSLLLAASALLALPWLTGLGMYASMLALGLAIGYLGPLEQTLMQVHADPQNTGSILLAYSALRTLLVPIGFFAVGLAVTHFGIDAACWMLGSALFVTLASLLLSSVKRPIESV